MIMSLDKLANKNYVWSSDRKLYLQIRAYYEDNGQKNMDASIRYVETNNLNLDIFPLFT